MTNPKAKEIGDIASDCIYVGVCVSISQSVNQSVRAHFPDGYAGIMCMRARSLNVR